MMIPLTIIQNQTQIIGSDSMTPEEKRARNREATKRYREKNREKTLEYSRQYKAKNREKILAYNHQYYAKNQTREAARSLQYYHEHKDDPQFLEKNRQQSRRRRERKRTDKQAFTLWILYQHSIRKEDFK